LVNAGTSLAAAPGMGAKDFTALDAWQLSHELQVLIVALLQRFPLATDYILRDQLHDAVASSPRHIAEGYGRSSDVEYARFLRFALGTLAETRNHLKDARDRGYITEDERQRGDHLARRAISATCGLRRALLSPGRP
jgi:four helix bundle protein